jgi:MFS family permease
LLLLAVEIYIFGISSAAISTNFIQMIIARITQRIGKSLFPIAFGIMRDKFEPERIAVAQGIFVSMFSVGCSNTSGHRWCLLNLICNHVEE